MTRRRFLEAGAAAVTAAWASPWTASAGQADRPRPTASQLAWQRDELAIFIHFGVNTFTNREWGDGREDPSIFAPASLDARQWARAARAAGARAMVLTAKHHDGFCLWPTRTTAHSVARSPFRAGSGDVVREFVEACRAEGLRPGLYLSPWDRNHATYGDSPRYNDVYAAQLTELLTNYGELAEVWFDGANGEGPNGKRQEYDWPRVWGLVRRLQPRAVMFSDAGPDVRWCGNETGSAGEPNWSMVDPAIVPVPGLSGAEIIRSLQHGEPRGTVWRPAEADTSIRPGWFYHPAEDARVRTVDRLVDLFLRSVGRNAKLLLNVPPTPAGLLHETDVSRLAGMRQRLDATFGEDLAAGRPVSWRRTGENGAEAAVDLPRDTAVGVIRMAENIAQGQFVSRYRVEGQLVPGQPWQSLSSGQTIGYARIDRVTPATVRRVRVIVDEAGGPPEPLTISLFAPQ